MTESRTALVIGVTGAFGGHAAAALVKRGWAVRALVRDPANARARLGARMPIELVAGDALDAASVRRAAQGASVIIHAANPPRYRNWPGLVLPMFDSPLAAAEATGARVVLPGNVYNYAPDAGPLIAENAPQAPVTRKGRIRVEMEARLERAAERGVRGLVLRAGDFFGPGADGGALAWLVRRQKERITGVFAPGPAEVGHAFAYLPDLGEALGRLMEREAELAPFARFHFAGHWIATGDLARAIGAVAGRPDLRPTLFPWRLLAALSPFNETFRELGEMRYLWRRPIGLDGSSLAAFLGAEPRTPLPTALAATLLDMGLKLGAGESAGADAVLATA